MFDRRRNQFSVKAMPGFAGITFVTFTLLYAPILILVIYSFNAGPGIARWEGLSLKWYWQAWNNQQVISSSIRSLEIGAFAAIVSTILATAAALATTRTSPFRGMRFIYSFINLPLMVPEIVTGVALLICFAQVKIWSGYNGLGYLFAAHTAFCIPFAYLPIRARLETMDLSLERAAADLYATPWMTFRHITLPILWPAIMAGGMLAFVTSLDTVVITEFIKSGGQDTLPTYMLGQFRRIVSPELNAISAMFLLLSVIVVTCFFFLSRKKE